MIKDEALRLALEALENWLEFDPENFGVVDNKAMTAIKAALEAKVEPVAYGMRDTMIGKGNRMMYVRLGKGQDGCTVPLYTEPPQRKPLTDEEITEIFSTTKGLDFYLNFARAIEAAHGIKGET